MELYELTAHEILDMVRKGEVALSEVYESLFHRVAVCDDKLNAYVRLFKDDYLKQDIFIKEKDLTKSFPIPIAVKDNICILNKETTCCSKILEGFKPPYDATVISRLKAVGVMFLGNANMDEFAFGSSTETSCYGPSRNPWDLNSVPGGSSGGSAAAVAAGEAIWAIGSDTGGSIRQPASFCGVVGLKPTYGRVSRYGLVAFASSLDQIGPITKDVKDAAILLNIIAGHDPMDSTSANLPVVDYTSALVNDVKGLRIGVPKEYFVQGINQEVKEAVMRAIDTLEKLGAVFEDVSLPHTEYAIAVYYIISTAEASSNLARFDGVQYGLRKYPSQIRKTPIVDMYEETRDIGFGAEAKRRIMLGTYVLSSGYYEAYYMRGLKVRTLIKQDFDRVFENFDAIITPTSPTTAFKIGEKTDPLDMYLSDVYTVSANLSGIPAISIPCGFSKDNLPIGLQILAKPFDEEMLFRIAYTYEQNTDWHKRRAKVI